MNCKIELDIERSENIDSNQGAYIFKDSDNDINLFIYIKLESDDLKELLPLSYNSSLIECHYLVIIIKNKKDHLGQNSFKSIKELIRKKNMLNILEKNYNFLYEKMNTLTREQYDNYFGFAKEQLLE